MTTTEKAVLKLAKEYAEMVTAYKQKKLGSRSELLRAEIALLDKAVKLSSRRRAGVSDEPGN